MLIVKTYIAPSSIHGIGIFAAEPLKAGTLVWVFDPVIDIEITKEQIAALPDVAREVALAHSFVNDDGRMILSRDNAVFFNHSDNPNTFAGPEGHVALWDISAAEELTESYWHLPPGACRSFLDDQKM
jgi:SET domain-containing protein